MRALEESSIDRRGTPVDSNDNASWAVDIVLRGI